MESTFVEVTTMKHTHMHTGMFLKGFTLKVEEWDGVPQKSKDMYHNIYHTNFSFTLRIEHSVRYNKLGS